MDRVTTTATATAEDNIRMTACDVAVARLFEPCWDVLPERGRMQALEAMARQGIGRTDSSRNTTCIELDELRVDSLNESAGGGETVSELAVGTDGTMPAHDNRQLNSEHARTDITEFLDNGSTLTVKVYLSKTEGNGATLTELGLYAGRYFLNHSLFSDVEKTSSKAITFEIDLSFDTKQ